MNGLRPSARALLAATIIAMPLLLPGCPCKQRPLSGSGMDMFGPAAMRIHPLTRILADPAQIEARVEFTDQMNDVTKGAGVLQFTLFKDEFSRGAPVDAWRFDLTAPQANKDAWDPITRMYLCRLALRDPAFLQPGRKYVLTAVMTFPNNTHLDCEFKITVPKTSPAPPPDAKTRP